MKMVFVSSTFKDMQFERDKLNTYVVPLIDESISQYGEQIFFGDLRWGVNTTQLDENEKVFYVLYYFNAEWQNGGLCQFFVNSSRKYAPLISEYLEIVGALEHKKMYDKFIKENGIDLNDLSFFEIDDLSEYQNKVEAYPFDQFDDAFYDLGELDDYLETFMKVKNI